MEGTCIRGGLALCEHSVLKMGSKIYGATTIGPHCKIGGEISNVVFQGYSNKAHDGFLGNSVIGEYCNFGAGSNASNLKNTYSEVKIWDIAKKTLKNTGQTFCGLIMGDYSRCAVQTAFNTACVVGIAANIFEKSEKNAKFIPSFSFGKDVAELDKTFQTIEKMKARRGQELTEREKNILRHIFKNI
jgi:UDP-N-acetylglucosamine diphosphorylase/glucosamine-1-phosphate N-acetyltransferase